jgi:hypothetical protein
VRLTGAANAMAAREIKIIAPGVIEDPVAVSPHEWERKGFVGREQRQSHERGGKVQKEPQS